ncbi:ArnT family glycosyltransferase [Hoeflea poritis]|uniref:Glycosyltransferase family 39 protein n=1 Tax=Hoeflea poritis TaxID=2993659 RepID=A0ABT4VQM5_9HYPH|nr:glycosyltransferase family 39 protein [Hoeflea poritis]MDA4846971.1 glycosyltransferase family 39 protein [Hoeflea poritis]
MIRQDRLPVAFVLLLLAYFLVQTLTFSLFKSGADIDTTELMMYNQFWSLGYWGSQPPLYNWMTHLAADVFGTSIIVYSAVKFFLLFAALVFVFLSARELGFSTRAAVASALGVFAVPEISWETQRALSHSAAVNAFCAMSLFAFVRLRRTGELADYGFFGLAAAAAALSKYNGVFFLSAIVLAASLTRGFAGAILNRKIVVSVAVFAVAVLPHLLWALDNTEIVFHRQVKFGVGEGTGAAGNLLSAVLSWTKANVLTAILVVVAVLATYLVDRARARRWTISVGETGRFLVLTILFFELILLGLLLFYGATRMENRWLQPVLLILPLTILSLFECGSRVDADRRPPGNPGLTRTFSTMGLIIMAATLVALPLSEVVMGRMKANETHFAYDVLLEDLEKGASGRVGTVVSNESDVFGNLLLYDPDMRFYSTNLIRAGHDIPVPAVLIWSGHGNVPHYLSEIAKAVGWPVDDIKVHRSTMPVNGNTRRVRYSYLVVHEPVHQDTTGPDTH